MFLYMFSVAFLSCYILQFDHSTYFQLVYLIPTGRIPGNTMLNTYSATFSTCYTLLPRQLSDNCPPTKQKTLLEHCPVTNKPSTKHRLPTTNKATYTTRGTCPINPKWGPLSHLSSLLFFLAIDKLCAGVKETLNVHQTRSIHVPRKTKNSTRG